MKKVDHLRFFNLKQNLTWLHTVVNMNVVNDDIADVLQCNAATAGNVDIGAATVKGLVAIKDEFLR